MKKFNNILLFGGETKSENMPVGFYSSLAMLNLHGKPIIWWQLNNLKKYGIDNFIIVVCKSNTKLIEYINNVLRENFDIKLVLINKNKNILSSLKYGLMKADINRPTRIILGDTLITRSINENTNLLFTSKNIISSENWCLVSTDNNNTVKSFYDKRKKLSINDKEALVGYYAVSDTKYLLNCCINARLFLKKELSTALIMYSKKYSLKTQLIDDWYDLGHTSGLIKAKNILFNARCFNSINVDTDKGLLTKTSDKIQKLEDEAYWFNNLPEDLKIYTPRFVSFKKDDNTASLTQELYGYPSLQELYLSGEVNIEDWHCIIEKLFLLHKNFEKYSGEDDTQSLIWLYLDKTLQRLNELVKQNEYWNNLIDKKTLKINGKKLDGLSLLMPKIKDFAVKLSKNGKQSVVHGDYCFSNILFDSSNYIFKLIDPRGRLNGEATIYGDARYDIAKLRHSVVGLYDFIVQGLFKITENEKGYEYKILSSNNYNILEDVFDKQTQENGFNVNEIKFIESLLFLSMIPLHKDNFERQKVFFLKSIELLNSVLSKR